MCSECGVRGHVPKTCPQNSYLLLWDQEVALDDVHVVDMGLVEQVDNKKINERAL